MKIWNEPTNEVQVAQGKGRWLAAASALALFATPMAIAAQPDAEANAGYDDDTIVVTAQFKEQRLEDTPLAITAATGEQLREKGIDSVADLSGIAPNVNISSGAAAFGPSAAIYIRGIGQYDNSFAYEPGVGVYIDDVYYGVIQGANFELLDLDRVEVLRGPQGTLSGKNSLGGSVKLFYKEPGPEAEGYLEAGVGSYDLVNLKGATNITVADNLFLRVSGVSTRKDGYVDVLDFVCVSPEQSGTMLPARTGPDCKTGTMGGKNIWGVRAAAKWLPTEDIEVNIAVDKTVDESEVAASSLYYANSPTDTYGGVPYDSRFIPDDPYVSYSTFGSPELDFSIPRNINNEGWGISGDVEWQLSDNLVLRSISAYRKLESIFGYDQDGSPIDVSLAHYTIPYEQLTQELRLSGQALDELVEWTIGAFYFDSEGKVTGRNESSLSFLLNDPVETTSQSLFGQAIVSPTDNLNFTLGIRFTDDEKSYQFSRQAPTGGPAFIVGALDGVKGEYEGDRTDYRVAVDYRWTPNFMTYAQYSTGYKGGGVNPKPFYANQVVSFEPETLDAYEAGFKSSLLDGTLRLDVAAFLNKYEDIILINQNGIIGTDGVFTFPSAAPFNGGDADITGIEIEANWNPTDNFNISGTMGYIDFEYQTLADDAVVSGIEMDDVPPLTPELQASLGASYTVNLASGATITPRVDVKHTAEVYIDPANNASDDVVGFEFYRLPSYTVGNAHVKYTSADGNWDATLSVSNLTDEEYYTNGFAFLQAGTGTRIIAPPREWAFSIRRNF